MQACHCVSSSFCRVNCGISARSALSVMGCAASRNSTRLVGEEDEKVTHTVFVKTGDKKGAGTDGNVSLPYS